MPVERKCSFCQDAGHNVNMCDHHLIQTIHLNVLNNDDPILCVNMLTNKEVTGLAGKYNLPSKWGSPGKRICLALIYFTSYRHPLRSFNQIVNHVKIFMNNKYIAGLEYNLENHGRTTFSFYNISITAYIREFNIFIPHVEPGTVLSEEELQDRTYLLQQRDTRLERRRLAQLTEAAANERQIFIDNEVIRYRQSLVVQLDEEIQRINIPSLREHSINSRNHIITNAVHAYRMRLNETTDLSRFRKFDIQIITLIEDEEEDQNQEEDQEDQNQEQEDDCPICLDTLCNTKSNCNHSFCAQCIKKTIMTTNSNNLRPICPICRQTISSLTLPNDLASSFRDIII
jgi:hypothetical protein